MRRPIFFILSLILFCCPLSAQQSLTLNQAIEMAQTGSYEAEISNAEYQAGVWQFNSFLSTLKPHLEFNVEPNYYKMAYDIDDSYLDVEGSNRFSTFAELRLNQKVTALGGDFYATSSGVWTEYFKNPSFARRFGASPIRLGYEQELIGFNPYKWDKKIENAKMKHVESLHSFEQWDIARKTARLYLSALRAKSLYSMHKTNAETSEYLYRMGVERYNLTSIRNDELVTLELQWHNELNSCSLAEVQMKKSFTELYSYVGMEDFTLVIPASPDYLFLDKEKIMALVEENNPVYNKNALMLLEARRKEDLAKKETGVQASVEINVGIDNYGLNPGSAYGNPEFLSSSGVNLRIPIIDQKTAQNKYKAAQFETQAADAEAKENLRLLSIEVDVALRDFEKYQTLVSSTMTTMGLADEAYRHANDNYANGVADINTFAISQARRESAYVNYLDALCCYWDAYYNLSSLCGVDILSLR